MIEDVVNLYSVLIWPLIFFIWENMIYMYIQKKCIQIHSWMRNDENEEECWKREEMRHKNWYNCRMNWNIVCWNIVFSKIRQDENSFNDISHKFLCNPFHFLINFLTMYTSDIIHLFYTYYSHPIFSASMSLYHLHLWTVVTSFLIVITWLRSN